MRIKEYTYEHICNLRLWLSALLLVVTHAFIQGQTATITYDNVGGPYSATIPPCVTSAFGEAWGGGGGGGGVYSGSNYQANGGGGGGGAYAKKAYIGGSVLSITIGSGGKRGENNENGGSGSASTITSGGATVTARGGGYGQKTNAQLIGSNYGSGGSGGTATGGDINLSGEAGGDHNSSSPSIGGGSPNGGGATGSPANGNNAIAGNPPGGGGSGARERNTARYQPGAKGADGAAKITFTYSLPVITGSTQICSGSALTLSVSNSCASATYVWKLNGTIVQTGSSTTYSVANATTADAGYYTVEAIIAGTYTYSNGTVVISGSGLTYTEGVFKLTSAATYITVNPTPVIANKTHTTCSGVAFTITPPNTSPDIVPTGTTYSWSAPSLPSGVTGANSGTNLGYIGGTLTNTTASAQIVTYQVTPKYLTCQGAPFNVEVTVNPKPAISDKTISICSGGSVNYTPAGGTIPVGTTYTWSLSSVSPEGAIDNPSLSGSGSSIDLGRLSNTSSGVAVAVYNVIPSAQGCPGSGFTLTVTVNGVPEIMSTRTTICSGDTLHLWLNNTMPGIYSSSDSSVAYVNPFSGVLYTDVELVGEIPERRPAYSANEGKGGSVTITFTTSNNCIATKEFIVTPRTKTPRIRWEYDGICPIDEGEPGYSKADSANIRTPWNPGGVYFANHIVWDSLVVNAGYADIPLSAIKWYADEARTKFIRTGGDPLPPPAPYEGCMANFWQNKPHPGEVYWATITTDSCESRPVRVEVYIYDNPEKIDVDDLIGYVQPAGTPVFDFSEHLGVGLDPSQRLEWYDTEEDAIKCVNEIGEPSPLDPTQIIDRTYWLVKADTYGCRSLPTPFRVQLLPMPEISIVPDTLVCPGKEVPVRVNIRNGTAPYNFKIVNMNSGAIDAQTDYSDDFYTFSAAPLSSVAYRITEFSDANTSEITYLLYGLHTPASGYFDEALLSVVVTEITGISPASGPTAGGTYTTEPSNPIDLAGTVTISGSGFAPFGTEAVLSVTFGGIEATNVEVIDNYTLTCTPPAHLSGYVTVSVTTGCVTVTLTDGYRYEPINIADIQPAYAPVTGGTTIIIRGTGLLAAENENPVTVTLAGVPARIVSVSNTEIVCITGRSKYSLLDKIVINNGSEIREFPKSFTYYPVNFIENGYWSEPHRWETQTADHILPYPNAAIHIHANCIQDIDVDMDSITVHPSKAYTLSDTITLKANVFTLKDNASFLDYNGDNSNMQAVQQNVEHILTKGRNWYVSSPVQGGTMPEIYPALGKGVSGTDLDAISGNEWRVEHYDETQHAWVREGKTSPFITGLGYTAYSADADIAAKFSGTYTDGDQTAPFTLTRQDDGHEKSGFNLMGNPFPSYWHWTSESAQQANLYSTIWYRTRVSGVYEFWSYNASGNVAVAPGWEEATPTGSYSLAYIPPMQAFWVRILDGQSSGTLVFSDNRRAHSDHGSNFLKSSDDKETRPLLRVAVESALNVDETVIYADPEAKEGFDTYDSDKWFVNQGAELFTLPASSTRELVINGFPEIVSGMEIPLGFQTSEGGNFTFKAKEIVNLDTLNVYLSDKWRNAEFDLRSGDYNFASSSVSVADRFSIVFYRSASGGLSGATGSDNLLVHADGDGQISVVLHLRNRQGDAAAVSVFDITGRKLTEQIVVIGEYTTLNSRFPEGVYILRAGKCRVKVVVK